MRSFIHELLSPFRVRQLLLAVVGLLSLLAIAAVAWNARDVVIDLKTAQRIVHAEEVAAISLRLTAQAAMERGTTSVMLSSPPAQRRDLVASMRNQRQPVDKLATELAARALELRSYSDTDQLARAIDAYGRARRSFEQGRAKVDRVIAEGAIDEGRWWFDLSSAYIDAAIDLRRAALSPVSDIDYAYRGNQLVTEIFFTISEYAGRERALVGSAIAAKRPLSAAELNQLGRFRSVVELGLSNLDKESARLLIQPGIQEAYHDLYTVFLGDFEQLRTEVYRASTQGKPYPVDAIEWYARATTAIQSIHRLSDRVAAYVHGSVQTVYQRAQWLLVGLGATVVMVVISFWLAFFVIRHRILTPLGVLGNGAARLGEGEIEASLPRLEAGDEFSELRDVLEVMRARLLADVQRREHSERELRKLAQAVEQSVSAIVITDPEGTTQYVNPQFERTTGYTPTEVLGRKFNRVRSGLTPASRYRELWQTIKSGRVWEGELQNRRRNGELYWDLVSISPVLGKDGEITHFVSVQHDISDRKAMEDRLELLAYRDELTGLPNRALFLDRISQTIARAERDRGGFAVLFMDLDRFKLVNDSFGHTTGDHILRVMADRLREVGRGCDTIARYGGDEFVMIITGVRSSDDVTAVAQRVLEAMVEPMEVDDREFRMSCSIGAALYPEDGLEPDMLLRNADAAMYKAKESGRNRLSFYTDDLNVRATERILLEGELRRAIECEEFVLYYQPQVTLRTGKVTGMEALLRWQHPTRGLVTPYDFLEVAEETGLIEPIGAWVLREACRQAKAWEEAGVAPLHIAVNVSARQFECPSFVNTVTDAIANAGISPNRLELEITESTVMANPDAVYEILQKLKAFGIGLAIDDFGTGYSSLGYLRRFSFDKLKIDRSFVQNVTSQPDDAVIATIISNMARSLRLRVVAEGVETEGQACYLLRNGCEEIQGFLFSRPLPVSEATALLMRRTTFSLQCVTDSERPAVLFVDDVPSGLPELMQPPRPHAPRVLAGRSEQAFELLATHSIGVMVVRLPTAGIYSEHFIARARRLYPSLDCIVLGGHGDLAAAMKLVDEGVVFRFFMYPWDAADVWQGIQDSLDSKVHADRASDANVARR